MNKLNLLYFISSFFFYQFSGCPPQDDMVKNQIKQTVEDSVKQENTTTFILVRHAEKDTIGKDPMLTKAGIDRAEELSRILSEIPLTAIYSSDYHRTKQTASPTAKAKNLEVNIYNPSDLTASANDIFTYQPNGVVLIVGHSNTTPSYVNLLTGNQEAEKIDESDYDNLFIVNASQVGDAEMLHLHYGK